MNHFHILHYITLIKTDLALAKSDYSASIFKPRYQPSEAGEASKVQIYRFVSSQYSWFPQQSSRSQSFGIKGEVHFNFAT